MLKRLASETDTPQLGFIKTDFGDYASYSRELEAVMPDYAYFTIPSGGPGLAERAQSRPPKKCACQLCGEVATILAEDSERESGPGDKFLQKNRRQVKLAR